MEQTMVDAVALSGSVATPQNLSLIGLFFQADWIVKLVILSLVSASVWTWTIILHKMRLIKRLSNLADHFEESFWSGTSLETLFDRVSQKVHDPLSAVFVAGMREWRHASENGLTESSEMRANLQQRIDRVMSVQINRELSVMEKSLGFLATVGSNAVYIGLFGTVWGVMSSFQAIAASKNTSLAVVAPGIAEALFATAIGLIATIPAVVAYNKFSGEINAFAERLEGFANEFTAILSRNLEER